VSQWKKYRSKTPSLDAIEYGSDSLVKLPKLPLDEPDDFHESTTESETAYVFF